MRNLYLDSLKGVTIWLVVIGHVIQTFVPSWQEYPAAKLIYMFHMPLFIAISGYFFSLSVRKYTFITYIKKIVIRLLLPSICWGTISCFAITLNKIINSKPIDLYYCIQVITTGLWYLTALFVLSFIGAIIHHYFNKFKWIAWGIIYCAFTFIIPYNTWMHNELWFLLPFFLFGAYYYKHNKQSLCIAIIASFLLIIYFQKYTFKYSMYEINALLSNERLLAYTIRNLSALSGIIVLSYLCLQLNKLKVYQSVFCYIGGLTLPIYALHQYFLHFNKALNYHTLNNIYIIGISILTITLSIITYKLCYNKWIKLFLFGENIKKQESDESAPHNPLIHNTKPRLFHLIFPF